MVQAPVPGQVKPRLAAQVGRVRATWIYRALIARVCERLPKEMPVIVMYDPPGEADLIRGWLQDLLPPGTSWLAQMGGDPGARLANAYLMALQRGYKSVAVIGGERADMSSVAKACGLTVEVIPELPDVDTFEDLNRLDEIGVRFPLAHEPAPH